VPDLVGSGTTAVGQEPASRRAETLPPIAEALDGRTILVTGATGFLGTALIERLLRCVPGCRVVALVRPTRRLSAGERARREILRHDCFDRLREELGAGFDEHVAARFRAVAGDVSIDGLGLDDEGQELLAAADAVVHAAATVAFDAPFDQAVEVNLLGPSRVAAAIRDAASVRSTRLADRPPTHLVSISTAYVAGTHQGEAKELLADAALAHASARVAPTVTTEVDIDAEVAAARRLRDDLEAESRAPHRLAELAAAARRELGAAGVHLVAERTERLRGEWVRSRLVEAGRARAQALGWPDAYAFTKALGERLLVRQHAELPITVVRPSIIESALAEPRPGWIRGFRMAEPIIISYARGLLEEFPGIPEGVIDVIPVDLVVAAVLAVIAAGPAPEGPDVYHVASGVRNPLRYGELFELVRSYFTEHPLYDDRGQPIVVPQWSFPGRGRVERQLRRASRMLAAAERVLETLPLRGAPADLAGRLEERRSQIDRARSYAELYGAYTETEARFRVDRLLALYERLHPDDRDRFCFDPAVVDWRRYAHEIHLPSIVAHARVRTAPTTTASGERRRRALDALLSPDRTLAVFDLEHTLLASNVVESYAWLATRHLPARDRLRVAMRLVAEAPRLAALDRRDRGDFLRTFYRRYEGASAEVLGADAVELWHDLLLFKCFPAGLARARRHRALGHRTVLVTGALDFVVEPLRPLFDHVISARLAVGPDGCVTGRLDELPPTGEARALALAAWASDEGLRLDDAVAYADSASDLPLLEAVGFPVAVNPDPKLAAIARRRGWPVETWTRATRGPRLPFGPPERQRARWLGSRLQAAEGS
jgi:fatty acyl-CoA reductase